MISVLNIARNSCRGSALQILLSRSQTVGNLSHSFVQKSRVLTPHFSTSQSVLTRVSKNDREALKAVKMALNYKQLNNFDKAQELFNDAIALSPNHHDVLLHYGEFLESCNVFINADHLYLKAIMLKPKNSPALDNRKRILPVVIEIDRAQLSRIDSKRAALVNLSQKDSNIKPFEKEMYVQHIYHTVAIEGNTMSLAQVRKFVETHAPISGKSIKDHNEILGLESALEYLTQTLAKEKGHITIGDILEIHRRVMGHVDRKIAGTFRKCQVYVGEHIPPPASEVEALMDEFVESLQSPAVQNMHPVHKAAFAHLKFVDIHPFVDGNGRTARLLMNLLFLRHGYPQTLIRLDEVSEYYAVLQMSHEGDCRPFDRFIARSTEYTIDAFLHAHEFKNSGLEALESVHDVKEQLHDT